MDQDQMLGQLAVMILEAAYIQVALGHPLSESFGKARAAMLAAMRPEASSITQSRAVAEMYRAAEEALAVIQRSLDIAPHLDEPLQQKIRAIDDWARQARQSESMIDAAVDRIIG